MIEKIKSALFGLAIGDALGVPVEFKSREQLTADPVQVMKGYGSWNQPPGTWSDDSSLAFCLAESLTLGYNIDDIANNFIKWRDTGFWGAHHKLFDIGGATRFAIDRLKNGTPPSVSGGLQENDNGNGSLMRVLPVLFYIRDKEIDERYQVIKEVSSITHAHFRSVFACFIYIELAIELLKSLSWENSLQNTKERVNEFAVNGDFNPNEVAFFDRVLKQDIGTFAESEIQSSGYVVHTLEAACWCVATTSNYEDAVLKAVNLGGDTDTTACVTGGIAGLLYGYENVPQVWIGQIARKDDIHNLSERLNERIK